MATKRPPPVPTVAAQWATCTLLCGLAAAMIAFLHPPPKTAALSAGLPLWQQAGVASTASALIVGAIALALAVPSLRRRIPMPAVVRALDLTGSKPLQLGLAAGVGEELLFRAALQPLVGVWWATAIFTVVHLGTAVYLDSRREQAIYLVFVAVAGLVLGVVYHAVGLLAAVAIHAVNDVAWLLAYRRLTRTGVAAGAPPALDRAPSHGSAGDAA